MLSVRIRTARVRAGLSQQDLARLTGVSRTAVTNWESSARVTRPSSERLEIICRLTNVSWEWLATGRGRFCLKNKETQALDAELVDDIIERRLLSAFRVAEDELKKALLLLAESSARGGGRDRSVVRRRPQRM